MLLLVWFWLFLLSYSGEEWDKYETQADVELKHSRINNWRLVRITLVVAFGFLPKNFGRWWGSMNDTFALYECSLSSVDNQSWWGHSNPAYCLKKFQTFCIQRWQGPKNFSHESSHPGASPCARAQWATWWNFHCLIFAINSYLQLRNVTWPRYETPF